MIKEIGLDEEEYFGLAEAGSSIKLSRIIDWFNKVNTSGKATYLKCVAASSNGCTIYNIVDIMFDTALMHKNITYANGVKIALKESTVGNAMTIAHAAELFNGIAVLCSNNGIDLSDVQVFAQEPNGKLTRFCWFYDDTYDVAYIVRNMAPGKVRKWLAAGAQEVLIDASKTPKKTPASEEKELYQYWIELFGAEGAKDAWKQSYPGKRVPHITA